jgi:phosphatidylserine/phosphatidylglycerophosphate/cardiolipin synthase-like enzyme
MTAVPCVTTLQNGGVEAVCKAFLYIHAKMVLADYGTSSAQAYIGSENFSCVSLNENRECGIIVTESAILDRLSTIYTSDWAQPNVTVTPDATPQAMRRGIDSLTASLNSDITRARGELWTM